MKLFIEEKLFSVWYDYDWIGMAASNSAITLKDIKEIIPHLIYRGKLIRERELYDKLSGFNRPKHVVRKFLEEYFKQNPNSTLEELNDPEVKSYLGKNSDVEKEWYSMHIVEIMKRKGLNPYDVLDWKKIFNRFTVSVFESNIDIELFKLMMDLFQDEDEEFWITSFNIQSGYGILKNPNFSWNDIINNLEYFRKISSQNR